MGREWNTYKVGALFDLHNGFAFKSGDFTGEGVPVLKIRNVKAGRVLLNECSYVSREVADRAQRFLIRQNDILITMTGNRMNGSPETWVGKVAIFQEEGEYLLNQRVGILRPKKGVDVNVDFCAYVLSSWEYQQHFSTSANSSGGQANISPAIIGGAEIALPERAVQDEIVAVLKAVDDKIRNDEEINRISQEIMRNIFNEWFVRHRYPETLEVMVMAGDAAGSGNGKSSIGAAEKVSSAGPVNVAGWESVTIGDLFEFTIGGDWGRPELCDTFTNEVFVIRGTDFSDIMRGDISHVPHRFIKSTNFRKKALKPGDIVFEISGGSTNQPTGRHLFITREITQLFPHPIVPASFCRLIRPRSAPVGFFLSAYLDDLYYKGRTWDYQVQSTGISNFQFRYFSEKELLMVPPASLLSAFAEIIGPFLDNMGNNIREMYELNELKAGLLPRLLKKAAIAL